VENNTKTKPVGARTHASVSVAKLRTEGEGTTDMPLDPRIHFHNLPNACQWHQHPANLSRKGCPRQRTKGNPDNLCEFHREAAKAALSVDRFVVQHEFDYEPTYVFDRNLNNSVVDFSPQLPWQLRQRLSKLVAHELEQADPVLGESFEGI